MRALNALCVALALTFLVGCGTVTPKKAAHVTLASLGAAASTAGDAVATARLAGEVSDADWAKAQKVYGDWLKAYTTACNVAAFDFSSYAPADLLKLQLEVLETLNQLLPKKP